MWAGNPCHVVTIMRNSDARVRRWQSIYRTQTQVTVITWLWRCWRDFGNVRFTYVWALGAKCVNFKVL